MKRTRNSEGAPYWANLTEIEMIRAMISHYRPETTKEELDALTFNELENLHWAVTHPQES